MRGILLRKNDPVQQRLRLCPTRQMQEKILWNVTVEFKSKWQTHLITEQINVAIAPNKFELLSRLERHGSFRQDVLLTSESRKQRLSYQPRCPLSFCRYINARHGIHRQQELYVVKTVKRAVGQRAIVVKDHCVVITRTRGRSRAPGLGDSKEGAVAGFYIPDGINGLIIKTDVFIQFLLGNGWTIHSYSIEVDKLDRGQEQNDRTGDALSLCDLTEDQQRCVQNEENC